MTSAANAKIFLRQLAVGFMATMVGILTLNFVVNPERHWGLDIIPSVSDNDRPIKIALADQRNYDSILIGSSKMAYIDPTKIKNGNFLNAAMVGSVPEEYLSFLDIYAKPPVKTVVLGLDLFMFNESAISFPTNSLKLLQGQVTAQQSPISVLKQSLSFKTTKNSLGTLWAFAQGTPPAILENGQRNPWFKAQADLPFNQPQADKTLKFLRTNFYADFRFSFQRVDQFAQIKQLLHARQIRLITILNPKSHPVLEMINSDPKLSSALSTFRATLTAVDPDLHDLTASRWSALELFYLTDIYHYRPETGAEFVNDILGQR